MARSSVPEPLDSQERTNPSTGCLPLFLRLTWMAFGNLALFICAGLIVRQSAPIFTDIAYFLIVVGLVLARYIDITQCNGLTSDEKPATLADWRRYAVLLVLIATSLWVLAHWVSSLGWI